jgi:type II secretory pathway component GspD/PulD (secretin)
MPGLKVAPLALVCLAIVASPSRAQDVLVSRLFKLEHEAPEAMVKALRHLGSGVKEARLDAQEGLNVVTVRDRAANVAAIEQAIRRLDVPRPDIVFQMRLLIASPEGVSDVHQDMQSVVRQLEQSLRFRAYHQVAALSQRVRSGTRLESQGNIQLAPPVARTAARASYELELRPVVTGTKKGARSVQLRTLRFELDSKELGDADIRTDVVVPEGEIVVVGTAALGERALVLVVWASPI